MFRDETNTWKKVHCVHQNIFAFRLTTQLRANRDELKKQERPLEKRSRDMLLSYQSALIIWTQLPSLH